MKTPSVRRLTGFVMPVGNGGVGKTSVSRVLDLVGRGRTAGEDFLRSIRKTRNLEFEYVTTNQTFGSIQYSVTLQLLVPPGQKQSEGDPTGRTFEKVIEIYQATINRVDVILFTYDMTKRESFDDLVYWVNAIGQLLNDATQVILLGTHLDRVNELEVTSEDIQKGLQYLRKEILAKHSTWRGNCTRLEVSNLTGKNHERLLYHLSKSVIRSRATIGILRR